MSKSKDEVRAMFGGQALGQAVVEDESVIERTARRPFSIAVKEMGLPLNNLAREPGKAKRLRDSLQEGAQIVELDPHLIEPSIIAERLRGGETHDAAFAALRASIAENGQRVPILVRSHPNPARAARGWFQAAYGHRRLRAAKELGIGIMVVVRAMNDRQLVVAQGNENAERHDLSYIERALFAQSIISKGFDRRTAQAAQSVDKTEMSRMLHVANSVPEYVVRAIGPAPRVGRPRWVAMGALMKSDAARTEASDEIIAARFRAAESDARFMLLFNRLGKQDHVPSSAAASRRIKDREGRPLARLFRSPHRTRLELDAEDHQTFGAYLAQELPHLADAFRTLDSRGGQTNSK